MKLSDLIKKFKIILDSDGDFEVKEVIKNPWEHSYKLISAEFDENGRTAQTYVFHDEPSRDFRKARRLISNECESLLIELVNNLSEYDIEKHRPAILKNILEIIRGIEKDS